MDFAIESDTSVLAVRGRCTKKQIPSCSTPWITSTIGPSSFRLRNEHGTPVGDIDRRGGIQRTSCGAVEGLPYTLLPEFAMALNLTLFGSGGTHSVSFMTAQFRHAMEVSYDAPALRRAPARAVKWLLRPPSETCNVEASVEVVFLRFPFHSASFSRIKSSKD